MLLDNALTRGWYKNNPDGHRKFVEAVNEAALKDREKAIARAEKWRRDNPAEWAKQEAATKARQTNNYQTNHYGPSVAAGRS